MPCKFKTKTASSAYDEAASANEEYYESDYNPENETSPYYFKLLNLFNRLKGRNPFSPARSP